MHQAALAEGGSRGEGLLEVTRHWTVELDNVGIEGGESFEVALQRLTESTVSMQCGK